MIQIDQHLKYKLIATIYKPTKNCLKETSLLATTYGSRINLLTNMLKETRHKDQEGTNVPSLALLIIYTGQKHPIWK